MLGYQRRSLQGQARNAWKVTLRNKENPSPLSGAEVCSTLETNNCTRGQA